MKKFFVLFVLVFGFAFGQSFEDWGVERQTDSFEGYTLCSQTILGTIDGMDVGITYSNTDRADLPSVLAITVQTNDPIYNIYGPLTGEQVRVKFENDSVSEIFDLSIGQMDTEINGSSWVQYILVPFSDGTESLELLTYFEGEVTVRLDGDNYAHDFVLPADWRAAFASGFLMECAPRTDWESS